MSDASTVCARTGYGRHVVHKWLIGKDEDKHARDGDRHVRKGSQPSLYLSLECERNSKAWSPSLLHDREHLTILFLFVGKSNVCIYETVFNLSLVPSKTEKKKEKEKEKDGKNPASRGHAC